MTCATGAWAALKHAATMLGGPQHCCWILRFTDAPFGGFGGCAQRVNNFSLTIAWQMHKWNGRAANNWRLHKRNHLYIYVCVCGCAVAKVHFRWKHLLFGAYCNNKSQSNLSPTSKKDFYIRTSVGKYTRAVRYRRDLFLIELGLPFQGVAQVNISFVNQTVSCKAIMKLLILLQHVATEYVIIVLFT